MSIRYSRHAATVDCEAPHLRVSLEADVRPTFGSAQERDSRARPASIANGNLEWAGAVLRRTAEITIASQTGCHRTFHEGVAQGIEVDEIGNGERPADTVERVLTALLVFGLAEERQHVLVSPTRVPLAPPIF